MNIKSLPDPHQLAPSLSSMAVSAYIVACQSPPFAFTTQDLVMWTSTVLGDHQTDMGRTRRFLVTRHGWVIKLSGLSHSVSRIGDYIWHPGAQGNASMEQAPSGLLDELIARDGYICKVDEARRTGDGEPFKKTDLSCGRILPGQRGGRYTPLNSRIECQKHNSGRRHGYFPEIHTLPVPDPAKEVDGSWQQRLRRVARDPRPANGYTIISPWGDVVWGHDRKEDPKIFFTRDGARSVQPTLMDVATGELEGQLSLTDLF